MTEDIDVSKRHFVLGGAAVVATFLADMTSAFSALQRAQPEKKGERTKDDILDQKAITFLKEFFTKPENADFLQNLSVEQRNDLKSAMIQQLWSMYLEQDDEGKYIYTHFFQIVSTVDFVEGVAERLAHIPGNNDLLQIYIVDFFTDMSEDAKKYLLPR